MLRNERYEYVLEPTGACIVWDKRDERPAELAIALIGLSEREAQSMCQLMNRLSAAGAGVTVSPT